MNMTRIQKRKAIIIEQLEATNDERLIEAVEQTLAGNAHYTLSEEQQRALDTTLSRYLRGEAKVYTVAQARARARRAARA